MNASADLPPGWSFPSEHTFVHRPTATYRDQIRYSLEKLARLAIGPRFQQMDGFLADDVTDAEIDAAYAALFCARNKPPTPSPDAVAWTLYSWLANRHRHSATGEFDHELDERRAG